MGLIVSVYRHGEPGWGDCSNNGVSNRFNNLCVINVSGPFEPSDDCPAVVLEKGPFGSVRIKPADLVDSGKVVMYGGNIAATSDSRFGEAIAKMTGQRFADGMAHIHDRVEG